MMKKDRTGWKPLIFVWLCWALVVASAAAHDTWLIPDRFRIGDERDTIKLTLTSGMTFPKSETSIKPARVAQARSRLAGRHDDLVDVHPARASLRCAARLANSGVAALWVRLKAKTLELTSQQVEEYLREIDAPAAIRERWERGDTRKRWRESYTKHAKTFVKLGDAAADRSWAEPVGLDLEIVPENDPTALRAGDEFTVRVLRNGEALPGFSLGVVGEAPGIDEVRKTDVDGRATFRLSEAGRWLLRGTDLRASTRSGLEWESDFTTLTFEVNTR